MNLLRHKYPFRITLSQLEMLQAVRSFRRRNGKLPTYDELGKLLGGAKKASIGQRVKKLQLMGYFIRSEGQARSLVIPTHIENILRFYD